MGNAHEIFFKGGVRIHGSCRSSSAAGSVSQSIQRAVRRTQQMALIFLIFDENKILKTSTTESQRQSVDGYD